MPANPSRSSSRRLLRREPRLRSGTGIRSPWRSVRHRPPGPPPADPPCSGHRPGGGTGASPQTRTHTSPRLAGRVREDRLKEPAAHASRRPSRNAYVTFRNTAESAAYFNNTLGQFARGFLVAVLDWQDEVNGRRQQAIWVRCREGRKLVGVPINSCAPTASAAYACGISPPRGASVGV